MPPTVLPTISRNPDGRYGPTSKSRYYKPQPYHGRSARPRPGKTRWRLSESNEYSVFKIADEQEWVCLTTQDQFAILDNGDLILGMTGERIAKFPVPQNAFDNWHGYPVAGERISPQLVDKWLQEGVISEHVRRKIERGSL